MSIAMYESDVEFFAPEGQTLKGTVAPAVSLYPLIGRDGSPNRILETHGPHAALERVTRQHALMADWVRAQGWGEDVPEGRWKYIGATRRLKACRKQLEQLVKELEESDDRY